jgi:hypothetical protein
MKLEISRKELDRLMCPKTQRVPDYLPFAPFGLRVTSRRKKTENHHSKEYLYYECR